MKSASQVMLLAVLAGLVSRGMPDGRAQSLPMGSGTNLSSVMYFDPPNDQAVKVRLSGAQMAPLPGAKYDVRGLTIERFSLEGKRETVARAAQCIYVPFDGTASSPGHLELSLDEGRILTQGDGFIWRQSETWLAISNHVHTVIKMGNAKLPSL